MSSHLQINTKEKIIGFAIFFLFVTIISINWYVEHSSQTYMYTLEENVPQKEAALILGAAVYKNGALTPILYDRAVTALELYRQGKVKKILVSGDNSTLEHNEVIPVSKFLIGQGVPKEAIFLDYAGFDTYDSMYRARDVFKASSLIIVTQHFHMPRSLYIAHNLGIDAVGVDADKRLYGGQNTLREYFATVKAWLDVSFHSKPEFLGEPVPIGSTTGNVPF